MPRIIEKKAAIARRIDEAVADILRGAPKTPKLKLRANKGTLKLNFATVEIESGIKRHLFDNEGSVYAEQYAAIAAQMPKKGESEPLAQQLAKSRKELQVTKEHLERSQTYAAHILTQSHLLELEIARLSEEIATLSGGSDEPLVGSGRLIGLPPPQRKTRRKKQRA